MSASTPPADEHYFDSLYEQTVDPWGFRSRWYEQRKRALTLAALPRQRYVSAIEAGCANGELAADLATRCDQLLACDFHEYALSIATPRLAEFQHVRVERRRLPLQWPDERFDLIVISELVYYLSDADLDGLLQRIGESLTPQGLLLACHWRHPIKEAWRDGDAVHRQFETLGLPRLLRHEEADFLLEAWSPDGTSVAQAEQLA